MRDEISLPPKDQMLRRLKDLRIQKGIKQKKVASKLDIPASQLSKLENQGGNPTYETIFKIWNAINQDLGGIGDKKASELIDMKDNYQLTVIEADQTVKDAAGIFCENDFSQAPVKKGSEIVGSITEKTLMNHNPTEKIGQIMNPKFIEVNLETRTDVIREILDYEYAVLVRNEKGEVEDLITRWDVLNAIRKN